LLFITASTKVISSFGSAPILNQPDPVFHLPYRKIFILSSIIELLVVGTCLASKNIMFQSCLVAWISTQFQLYRVALMLLGMHYCGCLGTVVDSLPINKATIHWVLSAMLAVMTLSSYAIIMWFCREKQVAARAVSKNVGEVVSKS
jgi:hypothetical protein